MILYWTQIITCSYFKRSVDSLQGEYSLQIGLGSTLQPIRWTKNGKWVRWGGYRDKWGKRGRTNTFNGAAAVISIPAWELTPKNIYTCILKKQKYCTWEKPGSNLQMVLALSQVLPGFLHHNADWCEIVLT